MSIAWDIKREILRRSKEEHGMYKCYYCEREFSANANGYDSMTFDHLKPKKYGSHDISNVVLSCKSCNSSKGKKDFSGRKENSTDFIEFVNNRKYETKIMEHWLKETMFSSEIGCCNSDELNLLFSEKNSDQDKVMKLFENDFENVSRLTEGIKFKARAEFWVFYPSNYILEYKGRSEFTVAPQSIDKKYEEMLFSYSYGRQGVRKYLGVPSSLENLIKSVKRSVNQYIDFFV